MTQLPRRPRLTRNQAHVVAMYRDARNGIKTGMTQADLDTLITIEPAILTQALMYGYKIEGDDAEFIANARTDIPALLAEIDELREWQEVSDRTADAYEREVARLRGALENVEALSFYEGSFGDNALFKSAIKHAREALE